MKRVAREEKPALNALDKPFEGRKNLEPRVIGRQAGEIVVPDDFCDEDPEILEMFGISVNR